MRLLMTIISLIAIVGCSEPQRAPSASDNVVIVTEALSMPGLDRQRQIRLYLPPGYAESSKKYPVLYMHDGQNLFDDATSYAGEWRVDETLNALFESDGIELIVVGIDNGLEKRMNELSPWENKEYGKAEGAAYLRFIIDTVKPYIDSGYRTKPDAQNTGILGSSMGGLISQYAIFEYPEVFTKAGIYSPSLWYSDDVYAHAKATQSKLTSSHKLHYLVGTGEGSDTVANLEVLVAQITEVSALAPDNAPQLMTNIVDGGQHNEAFWSAQFAATIKFLYAQ